MSPGTPGAKIPLWHTRLSGAWLIKIGDHHIITLIDDARKAFDTITNAGAMSVVLLIAHPGIHPDISRIGLLIFSVGPFLQLTHELLNDH